MSKYLDKVCVLLAAYNGQKYIADQVESILNQEGVDVDIYIRLDPSTDNSLEIIEELEKLNCNIHVLPVIHSSGGAGQNFLNLLLEVEFSDYDFIAFSDQDDIWLPKKLLRAIDCINNNNTDAYSGNVLAWWDSGKEKLVNKANPQKKYDYLFESSGPGCTFVFTKELALDFNFFLDSLGKGREKIWLHDWFCYAYARSRDYKWFIDAKPMMLYRQHDSNSVGANSGIAAFKSRVNEVITGSAFKKVISQALLLGNQNKEPIRLILSGSIWSSLKLALKANQCRRKPLEQLIFAFAILVSSFTRGKNE